MIKLRMSLYCIVVITGWVGILFSLPLDMSPYFRVLRQALKLPYPILNACFQPEGTSEKSFDPSQCERQIFGASDIGPLDPLWAQRMMGSFLKDDLLTEEEKQIPVKAGLIDSELSYDFAAVHNVTRVCEEPADVYEGSLQHCHGQQVATLMCRGNECSSGISQEAELYYYLSGEMNKEDRETPFVVEIHDAAVRGIKVLNISMQAKKPEEQRALFESSDVQEALKIAHENNMVVVWASGNEASADLSYTFEQDSVFFVGSVNPLGKKSSFSNYGNLQHPNKKKRAV